MENRKMSLSAKTTELGRKLHLKAWASLNPPSGKLARQLLETALKSQMAPLQSSWQEDQLLKNWGCLSLLDLSIM
jgi:hypothetical protein